MAKPCFAILATRRPIPPKPISPSTFPEMSVVGFLYLNSKFPARVAASACTRRLTTPSIKAIVCSATAPRLASGVLTTGMPRAVARSTAMASTPIPCEPITLSLGAASMAAAVNPALRVITAVASPSS